MERENCCDVELLSGGQLSGIVPCAGGLFSSPIKQRGGGNASGEADKIANSKKALQLFMTNTHAEIGRPPSMNFPASATPPAHGQRLRFSLAGMFVATFGIAVGLACWRAVGGDWRSVPYGAFAAFAAWFMIGISQEIAWRLRLRASPELPREIRTGLICQIAVSLSLIALLLAVIGREVVDRFQISDIRERFPESWAATRTLFEAGFLLVVLIAYGRWERLPNEARLGFSRNWRFVVDSFALAAGVGLLGLLLAKNLEMHGWVWLAIRGVENYVPTRWGGRLFSSREIPDGAFFDQFFLLGCGAVGLLGAAMAAVLSGVRGRRAANSSPVGLRLATLACLSGVVWLLSWCYFIGLPRLSPSFAEEVARQPEVNFLLAVVLMNAVSMAAATRIASHAVNISPLVAPPRFLHRRKDVIAACLLGVLLWLIGDVLLFARFASPMPPTPLWFDWPSWARWLNYIGECTQIHEPAKILSVVAVMVLLPWMWRRDSSANEQATGFISVDTGEFVSTWVGMIAILVVAGPVFAWWGFALTLKYLLQQ
jgi:hypothetical protein